MTIPNKSACIYFVKGVCCIPGTCRWTDKTSATRCREDGMLTTDHLTPKDPTNYQMNRIESNVRRINHE